MSATLFQILGNGGLEFFYNTPGITSLTFNSATGVINNSLSFPGGTYTVVGVASAGTSGQILQSNGSGNLPTWTSPPTSGTVTSVSFTGDGTVLSSTPSAPVTTSGTLTATLNMQSENTILAGPTSGSAATPTFRALVAADLPAGTGTVTSVSFTGDGTILSATPSSPVTTNGTVMATLNTQAANTILAGPTSGSATDPTFRSLVATDVPLLNQNTTGTASGITSGNGNIPGCSVYLNTPLNMPAGANLPIPFDTVLWNIGSYYSTSTYKFTPLKAGIYLLTSSIGFYPIASLTNDYAIIVNKNGTDIKIFSGNLAPASLTNGILISGSCLINFNGSTDYIQVNAVNAGTAGNAVLRAGQNLTWMDLTYIGPSS